MSRLGRSPSVDWGNLETKTPQSVRRPGSVDDLAGLMRALAESAKPYVVQGTAHSSGGQALSCDTVIETRRLNRIVADNSEEETITVEGGAQWKDICRALLPQRRRPLVLTDNLHTTVSGTLAVGGFGDTSHLHGLQAATVREIVLITPRGERKCLKPRDKLFRYVICGRGQLGFIAQATLKTHRREKVFRGRMLAWRSLEGFISAVESARDDAQRFEFFRGRLSFDRKSEVVRAHVGNLIDDKKAAESDFSLLKADAISPAGHFPTPRLRLRGPRLPPGSCCPALELVFPLPDGLAVWRRLARRAVSLRRHFIQPPSLVVLPGSPELPLAPLPGKQNLLIALRPVLSSRRAAHQILPILHDLTERALESGARLYLMSVEPRGMKPDHFLQLQFGAQLGSFRAWKDRLDPARICNRWLL